MIKQLVTLLAAATTTLAQVYSQYPPGLTPAMCPNYPYCDPFHMVQVHPVVAKVHPVVAKVHPMMAIRRRSDYPANVNPATCPNYPYCNLEMSGRMMFKAPMYPANMNPRSCPNYPFCQRTHAPVPADVDPAYCPNYPYCPIFTNYENE